MQSKLCDFRSGLFAWHMKAFNLRFETLFFFVSMIIRPFVLPVTNTLLIYFRYFAISGVY